MPAILNRLLHELLNAELDINSSTVEQAHAGAISVTARLKPIRLVFGAVFALPCAYFLIHLANNPGLVNLAIALTFCPAMALLALLLGAAISSKSIDRRRGQTRKSLRLFSFRKELVEPLAKQGVVTLTWTWSKSGDQTKGYSKYAITVLPGVGLTFVTLDDYPTARAFGERLAMLLSFPLEDRVPEANRTQGANDRLAS